MIAPEFDNADIKKHYFPTMNPGELDKSKQSEVFDSNQVQNEGDEQSPKFGSKNEPNPDVKINVGNLVSPTDDCAPFVGFDDKQAQLRERLIEPKTTKHSKFVTQDTMFQDKDMVVERVEDKD